MRTLAQYALSIGAAAALLVGCGGAQPPIGAPGAMPQSRSLAARSDHSRSWMLPEVRTEELLYLPDVQLGEVAVYTYRSGDWTKTLTVKDPVGECVDKPGNVWIVDARGSEIVEYAHGVTQPKSVLSDSGQQPIHCAADTTTGNLAVANIASKPHKAGSVSIFIKAHGTPREYSDPAMPRPRFLNYDAVGDLFIEGENSQHQFAYAELSKGSKKFTKLVLSKAISYPNGIQWDGRYIAVGNGLNIYQTSGGRVVGTTHLKAECNSAFFIQSGMIAVLCDTSQQIEVFRYPSGGTAIKTIDVNILRIGLMTGVVLSR